MSEASFRILHVCTGNICRSPMAEHLTRHGLLLGLPDAADRFVVESSGTWGHAGSPMEPHALTTLFGMGLGRFPETSYWRSRLLASRVNTARHSYCYFIDSW